MPAKSKAQQKFMGMVHAAQKGELDDPSPAVKKAAEKMKPEDAKDFAKTKHKDLPAKVKKEAKAVSQAQRKYMGMVHAYQQGDISDKDLEGDKVQKTSKTIKKKDAKTFADTKQKGLPKRAPKKESKMSELYDKKDENTLTDLPNGTEYGYTEDGVVKCVASKNICMTRMNSDRERNPGRKYQLIYIGGLDLQEGDSLEEKLTPKQYKHWAKASAGVKGGNKKQQMNKKQYKHWAQASSGEKATRENVMKENVLTETIRELARDVIKEKYRKLHEKVEYADLYSRGDGVPIGITDDGIYVVKMETDRGYFSMTADILAPVTEEMIKEWEADSLSSEIDYYWEDFGWERWQYFDWYDDLYNEKIEEEGQDIIYWNDLSSAQKDEVEEYVLDDMIRSKMDNMSGNFDWKWGGKSEEWYLEDIGGGQADIKSHLKTPIIPKNDVKLLQGAWDKLHLKKIKDMDAGQLQLMKAATKTFDNLKKNFDKLTEKSLQLYMLRGKKEKMIGKVMKKLGYKTGKLTKSDFKNKPLPLFKGSRKKK